MSDIIIDPAAWEVMKSMTDPVFLDELINIFLYDSPVLIEQMRTGLQTGDIEGLQRAAHTLKSSAASLGANRLAEASRDLEFLAKGGKLDGGAPKLATVEVEYARLASLLVEMKNEH